MTIAGNFTGDWCGSYLQTMNRSVTPTVCPRCSVGINNCNVIRFFTDLISSSTNVIILSPMVTSAAI